MNQPHWIKTAILALVLFGIGAGVGHWTARKPAAPPSPAGEAGPETSGGPVAEVKTVPLKRREIKAVQVAYGTVIAAPSDTHTFSVPYESRVKAILIATGQAVQTATPLIEVEPSPDTVLELDQAQNERDGARKALELVQRRLELKLATRQDQLQAQQQLEAANLRLHSLKARGVERSQILRAAISGVVSEIAVQPGQIVSAGGPLLNTIGENQIVVRLGIENEDAARVREDQPVEMRSVNAPGTRAVAGTIRFLASRVNPQTRLVDVFVAPDPTAHFILNEYVQGNIVLAAHETWVVPRAAVLPEEGRDILYTVEAGRAVKQDVTLGLQNDREVEVIGENLQADAPVVVMGNSQLQPGMAVRESAAP
jgi:membrane fusion protein, multidrug efflux system